MPPGRRGPPYEEWLSRKPARTAPCSPRSTVIASSATRARPTGQPHRLEHGLTAVLRSHRRRGLGSALKRAQINWAAGNGYRELTASRLEGNAPMRALNNRLGYRQLPPVIVVGGSAR